MKHPLTQEWESCPAISHAFEELSFVDLALDDSIAVGQSQACGNSRFISLNAEDKTLQFRDVTVSDLGKPGVALFAGASTQHRCKLLNYMLPSKVCGSVIQ